jgi:hypothetical protein
MAPRALQRHDSWEDDPEAPVAALAAGPGADREPCGWLLKRSNGKGLRLRLGSVLPHWNRRWVALDAAHQQLKYYRDRTDDQPVACVALAGPDGRARVTWHPPSLEFVVHTSSRELRFKADSTAAAASWVDAIRGQSGASGGGGAGSTPAVGPPPADGEHAADADTPPTPEESSLEYVEPASILGELTAKLGAMPNVRLLRWSFLDARARAIERAADDAGRAALALPRRQQLERECPDAFYSAADVASLDRGNIHFAGGPLQVVAVSHCARAPGRVARRLPPHARSARGASAPIACR